MRRDNIMKNILVDQNVYFVILLFTTLPFLHTIFFSFSPLDDAVLILGRLEWLQDYKNIYSIFTEPLFAGIGNYYYRPILILTFMIDAITGGGSPVSFHISNIVFHTIASLLVFEIFKKFELSNLVSILAALIFILHPVNISAISWIPGRNDTLLTIFILTSFLQWIKYLKSGNNKYLIFHLISYLIALLTKENATIFPGPQVLYGFNEEAKKKATLIKEMADVLNAKMIPMYDYRPKYPKIDAEVEINPNHPNLTIWHNNIKAAILLVFTVTTQTLR